MKISQKTAIMFFSVLFFFTMLTCHTVHAEGEYELLERIPGIGQTADFPTYMQGLYNFAVGFVAVAALFMVSIGGFYYIASAGNQAQATTAKKIITDALLGLIVVFLTYTILNVINPTLLNSSPSLASLQQDVTRNVTVSSDVVTAENITTSSTFCGEFNGGKKCYSSKEECDAAASTCKSLQKSFEDSTKNYIKDEMKKQFPEIERLALMIEGARKTTGQHPGGMVVVPSDKSVYEFTPIQKPANDMNSDSTTTHFDYHVMDEQLVKLDILGHDDPTTLKNLEDLTGISPYDVPLTDPKVLSLFSSTEALNVTSEQIETELGTNGIPEFGTAFVKEMLKDTLPKTFTELVRISGLSHGTDVWLNNAQDYVNQGIASLSEIISVRDDIMNYLIIQGIDKITSFKIMEFVRKGRPNKDKEQWEKYKKIMQDTGVKSWYIDSCEKIKYMFPKGHAVAYVMMAMRIAYFKVYHPLEFYTAYLNRKVSTFTMSKAIKPIEQLKARYYELKMANSKNVNDKAEANLLEILIEMHYRNIELLPVDLYKSEAKTFVIHDGKIRLPFITVDQLGDVVAQNIVLARNNCEFSSQEDLSKRTGVNNSVMNTLNKYGIVSHLNETDQQTLF